MRTKTGGRSTAVPRPTAGPPVAPHDAGPTGSSGSAERASHVVPETSATPPAVGATDRTDPRRTRVSHTWVGLTIGFVALVIVLIFILQNTQSVRMSFFTASG
jgi:hypothetical protein